MPALPTPQQLAWQDLELGLFVHYDIFAWEPDWDYRAHPERGVPSPSLFNPPALDTDQWLEAGRSFGARYAVLTAKHCSGFCLWPTAAYPYSVAQAPWEGGQGDVVRLFVDSCRRYGVKPGLYCSFPANWYLNVDDPGLVRPPDPQAQARYARIYEQQVRELWGNYGELAEIWFDGEVLPPDQGGLDVGPILAELQPNAMVFNTGYGTIRWVGNEDGVAPDPCWSTVDSAALAGGRHADPNGPVWLPAEVDTTLLARNLPDAWMWKPGCERMARSLDELVRVYEHSVGRNSNLLLNASPGPDGLIPEAHMARYQELGRAIDYLYGTPLAETTGVGKVLELALPVPASINRVVLMEDLAHGERVRAYTVEVSGRDGWRPASRGTCIGHKKIDRFDSLATDRLRLRIEQSAAEPQIRRFAVFGS